MLHEEFHHAPNKESYKLLVNKYIMNKSKTANGELGDLTVFT